MSNLTKYNNPEFHAFRMFKAVFIPMTSLHKSNSTNFDFEIVIKNLCFAPKTTAESDICKR